MRTILAVITGYAIFVVSAVVLFKLAGVDPHADASAGFIALTISYGFFFSVIGGFFTQLISRSEKLSVNYILAAIIAGFALFSLFRTTGNHYSQFAAVLLFAPASIFGGFIYVRTFAKKR